MSSYEDYEEVARHYDATREPVGVEIILGALAVGTTGLADTHLLDAGCGTGSYAAAVSRRVARLSLLDASEAMLAIARAKLAAVEPGVAVDARCGRLQQLPFEASSFDAVMTNQVLHHLGDQAGDGWPEHARVFGEYARVVRPGGVLVINTCSHRQIRHGYWPSTLIPEATETLCRRYAPLDVLEGLAEAHGFEPAGRFVPVDGTIQGADYFDPAGPFSATWRRADSTWSLVDDAELATALADLGAQDGEAARARRVAELDAERPHIGQVTFLAARRLG